MTRPKSWDEVFAANGYVRVTTSGRVTDKPEPPDNPEGHRAPTRLPRVRDDGDPIRTALHDWENRQI